MITYFKLTLFLLLFSPAAFSQRDTLSAEEAKSFLSQLNIDTVKMLRDYAGKACACIDSIKLSRKDHQQISKSIGECIDRETLLYQSVMEIHRAMKNGSLNIELNVGKESHQYQGYYFRIEEWLTDSCAALKSAVVVNNAESELSVSKNKTALEHYNKGMDLVKEENYKEGLIWFEKAVKADPNFAFAWDNIGICYRRLGKYDEALAAYNRSLALDPKGKTPLQNIPVVYQFKEQYEKAIEAYNNLLVFYPGDPEGYYGIGRMYLLTGNLGKGLDNMCKAYNRYVAMNSPYRVDAQKIISAVYKEMRSKGQEELFNKILKDNNISVK